MNSTVLAKNSNQMIPMCLRCPNCLWSVIWWIKWLCIRWLRTRGIRRQAKAHWQLSWVSISYYCMSCPICNIKNQEWLLQTWPHSSCLILYDAKFRFSSCFFQWPWRIGISRLSNHPMGVRYMEIISFFFGGGRGGGRGASWLFLILTSHMYTFVHSFICVGLIRISTDAPFQHNASWSISVMINVRNLVARQLMTGTQKRASRICEYLILNKW